ncbi:CRISPR-associated protein Cas2 [Natranaerovirga hydrolytica]|uniref:CRISPR-associated endoribonuclease Cas2 n=1 Tax=Natranaerovirga hydrolytica TaxID=680378 RepID=A0A4V2Q1R8_9FIRM|nr:CRISPR-associated endonuclease Cas2 [Natranaerovirga hydrolytica]TCK98661.1 CRISPR-associated protein Cas2 [Natranaerovirga hydrolytica]
MKKNYNYVFLFYDVNEKRVAKVFKICKKYLTHHQKSVFRGEITPSKLMSLQAELEKIINKNEDFVTFINLLSDYYFDEVTLGKNPKEPNGELFL